MPHAVKEKDLSYLAQFSEADISYTDNAKPLFTIPDGARIYSVSIVATTGFNGTTPTYDLGYATDPDEILDGITLPSTATNTIGTTPTATAAKWASGITSGKIIGTFVGGGSNTAGAGKLRIAYYVP